MVQKDGIMLEGDGITRWSEIKRNYLGNWFRFRFVFVSCVRASGRGEAAWACEASVFSTLVSLTVRCATPAAPAQDFSFAHLLLYTRVLRKFTPICYYTHRFKENLRICCYT